MIDKIRTFMEQYEMIQEGDHVLAGVSGGADSLCLLCLLQDLTRIWKFQVSVLHVEHGIRGEASRKDMEFVQQFCREREIPCLVRCFDVPKIAKEQGMTEEEAGRMVRYQALEEEAAQIGANKIAVAHHANDLAETMLFFLCRGTGLKGLSPMQPVRGNILRPLLCVTRQEIETYLDEKGLEYCKDVTNENTDYTRNKIRHEVIPVLEQINPKAVEHFGKTACLVQQAGEVLTEQTELVYARFTLEKPEGLLIKQDLAEAEQDYLILEVIRRAMETLSESRKDISMIHIEAVRELFFQQVGRQKDLPYGLMAERTYEGVLLLRWNRPGKGSRQSQDGTCRRQEAIPVKVPGITDLGNGKKLVTRFVGEAERTQEIPTKQYTKWMDYDIIKDSFFARQAEPEDEIVIDGQGNRKKIKKLFTDEKIPRRKRDQVLLLADGNHVFWVVGVRLGEDVKISPVTRQVLEISFYQEGEETHE